MVWRVAKSYMSRELKVHTFSISVSDFLKVSIICSVESSLGVNFPYSFLVISIPPLIVLLIPSGGCFLRFTWLTGAFRIGSCVCDRVSACPSWESGVANWTDPEEP